MCQYYGKKCFRSIDWIGGEVYHGTVLMPRSVQKHIIYNYYILLYELNLTLDYVKTYCVNDTLLDN